MQPPEAGVVPSRNGRQWISLLDDHDEPWLFDVAFLLSGYNCIYGQGCPSIDTEPDVTESLGCCIHGAHLSDTEDLESVASYAALLDDSNWQYRRRSVKKGGPFKKNKAGDWVTRKADGACIFLNREGFPGGAGCALHRGALERGQRPLDWKPDVCWQVPIHLDIHTDDHGSETVLVRGWERRDWGGGGDEFHWWCTEESAAHHAPDPVYITCRDELTEMVGSSLYGRLASELDRIRRETPVTLTPSS